MQALLPDILGRGGNAGRNKCATIKLVPFCDAPEHMLALMENWRSGNQITDMGVAAIGIVTDDHIAFMNIAFKRPYHFLYDDLQRIGVYR